MQNTFMASTALLYTLNSRPMPRGFELCILSIMANFKEFYHIIQNRHLHVQSQLKKTPEQDSKHALSKRPIEQHIKVKNPSLTLQC